MAGKHTCSVWWCEAPIAAKMAMCKKHWNMVPKPLQRAIWSLYVPGQEQRLDFSPQYIETLLAAVMVVHSLETQTVEEQTNA